MSDKVSDPDVDGAPKQKEDSEKSSASASPKGKPNDRRKEEDKKINSTDTDSDGSTPINFLGDQHQKVQERREHFLSMKIEEKRKLYKCKNRYNTLDDVTTWPQNFTDEVQHSENMDKWWKANKKNVKYDVNESLNSKMSLFVGDITSLEIDAIANAANEFLLGGGGVDGAIHNAAGPNLFSECKLLNGCDTGDAKISCGYNLPAKYVIHTVGPYGEFSELLKSCYMKSLDLMKKNELKSVAFPCISTGTFGYPNVNAAEVALQTIRDWLENEEYAENIERIIFCLFLKKDVDIYSEQMQLFFPLQRED